MMMRMIMMMMRMIMMMIDDNNDDVAAADYDSDNGEDNGDAAADDDDMIYLFIFLSLCRYVFVQESFLSWWWWVKFTYHLKGRKSNNYFTRVCISLLIHLHVVLLWCNVTNYQSYIYIFLQDDYCLRFKYMPKRSLQEGNAFCTEKFLIKNVVGAYLTRVWLVHGKSWVEMHWRLKCDFSVHHTSHLFLIGYLRST